MVAFPSDPVAALPPRSPGVLLSGPLTAVAQDLVACAQHRLNPSARDLLARCDGATDRDALVAEWARTFDADPDEVANDLDDALRSFEDLGLIGRTTLPRAPRRLGGTAPGGWPHRGIVHPVVGHAVAFAGPDPDLVELADRHLGPGLDDVEPTRVFTLVEASSGQVTLTADSDWVFVSRAAMLDQLTNAVNEYGHEDAATVALHAACVVDPAGRIVLLPAHSGAGKSTLAAHLVQAGWGYLGDEATGVRGSDLAAVPYPKPLALSAASREALSLPPSSHPNTAPSELDGAVEIHTTPPGPIDLVVLPEYRDKPDFDAVRLEPTEALQALIANTLNLPATGQPGFEVLDRLATSVPVHRVGYADASDVERWILDLR